MNSTELVNLATEGNLDSSINKAQSHYRSLFSLPSLQKSLAATVAICIIVGLSTFALFPSIEGLASSALLAVAIFSLTFLADLVVSNAVLKEPIFTARRTAAVSLFSWAIWLFFILLGVAIATVFGSIWWVNFCLIGFAALSTLRAIVFSVASTATMPKRVAASLLTPVAGVVPFAVLWFTLGVAWTEFLPFIVISPFVAWGFSTLFLHLLSSMGQKSYGVPSITIFRAFMLNWVASLNTPLEDFLEKTGKDVDIEVSLLKFDSDKTKAAVIVPLVHPGPFKNIGSSPLPSLMKHAYEKEYHCDACVPLGLLGHELDAASQAQNQKIIAETLRAANFPAAEEKATPFVKVTEDSVTASCQIFGKTALLSFTLAPKTTEDLPQELGSIVREEAGKLGLECALAINAHNSLTETTRIEATTETLRNAAKKCLEKAAAMPSSAFEVGAATVYPKEFSLKDGMGDGGIAAIAVKVEAQTTAYIIIDGNNMVSGLREKILSALTQAGFQEAEVYTTDTHAVSAVVLGRRGYHPVGEAMTHEVLISHITEAALTAKSRLETCRAGFHRLVVPNIRVLGEESLGSLTALVDRSIQKAKRIVAPIFASEGLLLLLLLFLL